MKAPSRYLLTLCLLLPGITYAGPSAGGPTQSELDHGDASTSTWLMTNKSYDGHRYVPLDQIDRSNVAQLQPVCTFDSQVAAPAQSTPLLYAGRIYMTVGATTVAMDATDCKLLWRHDWPVKGKALSVVNRGPAIKDGVLVRGTPDGYLIALAMADGSLLWQKQITSAQESHYLSMPAMIVEDRVIYGTAGADWGGRGWIGAFKLTDGTQLWRYEALPSPGAPGSESWGSAEALAHGGASYWTPVVVDRARHIVYVANGNPAPDFYGEVRPGDNAGTNSVVALDLDTGKPLWAKQFLAHDTHDWDLDQVGPLLNASFRGKTRNLLVVSGKDGRVRLVDRDSYEVLSDLPVSRQENAAVAATVQGVHICPGLLGGQEWSSSAFNSNEKIVIAPMVDWCGTVHHDPAAPVHAVAVHFYGGGIDQDPIEQARGVLAAIDVETGTLRWRMEAPAPMLGNVTATSGGIVLAGDLKGNLFAVDVHDGAVLLRYPLGASAGGGLFTYSLGGRQYVAAVSGPVSAFFGGGTGTAKLTLLALPPKPSN
jgi:alcohol dehydrogenase (cytochrome c)